MIRRVSPYHVRVPPASVFSVTLEAIRHPCAISQATSLWLKIPAVASLWYHELIVGVVAEVSGVA
jgi:hypothetical protein